MKFGYLLQGLKDGSTAKQSVECYPPTAENYSKAIAALKERYDDRGLLLQVYVRELLKLVISNATKKDKLPLSQLRIKLESHWNALKSLELAKAEPETWLLPLIESSLDRDVLVAWERCQRLTSSEEKKSRIESLMEFLKTEDHMERRIGLVESGF